MCTVIEVSGLSKSFGQFKALNQLSFSVNQGDIYGFLGQNGAGKSTTIRALLSLIHPDEGDINIFGYSLYTHRNKILKNIGAIIDRPDLYPFLTGIENLMLFAKMSGVRANRHKYISQLEQVGLGERYDSKVQTYSQGMKQRLGIAIALIHDPALIILDEPTNGLDPQGIADMRNLILWMRNELKKTVFVSSHLLSEVEQVANKMLIIDKGKKIIEGDARILFNPDENYVFISTEHTQKAITLIQHSDFISNDIKPEAHGFQIKMRTNDIPLFNTWLVQNNIAVKGIRSMHSLEQFFIQVTSANQHVETYPS
jgi:ABC-type multidrug transport system ATPase subunit